MSLDQYPTQLETKRLSLRPLVLPDWPAVSAYTSEAAVVTYIPEGHFLKYIDRVGGVWWDEYFYATLQEEWFRQNRDSASC